MMKINWHKFTLYFSTMVIETCWLYALLALINKQITGEQISLPVILLLYPIAFGLNKFIQRLGWHKTRTIIISWLAWAIAMLIIVKAQLFNTLEWTNPEWIMSLPLAASQLIYTFKPELLIMISSGIIWWLGCWLARTNIKFAVLVTRFQFGMVLLIITFVSASVLQVTISFAILVTMIFFFFSLLGISVSHSRENKGLLHSTNRLRWSGILLLSIALVIILGALISLLLSRDLLQLVVDALNWLGSLIMKILLFLASLLPKPEPNTMLPPVAEMPSMSGKEDSIILNIPEALRNWLNVGMAIIWGGLIVAAVWQLSSRIFNWLQNRLSTADMEIEPLTGAFRADLLGWLKRIFQKLSKLKLLSWLMGKPKAFPPEVISVHQIYRLLLRWGAKSGHPRKIFQTPDEYFYTLAGLLPQAQQDLSFITRQYVITRYSTAMPGIAELHELKQSWDRIKQNRFRRPGS
jgi:hypothetical protein